MSSYSNLTNPEKWDLCHRLGVSPTQAFAGIKRVDEDGIAAMIGLDRWAFNSVEIHIWLRDPHALTRQFIRECFRYIFITSNLGIAIGVTPCNNVRALELNKRLGFREVYRLKDGFALGTDSAIQVMRREECRWIAREVREWAKTPRQPQIIPAQPSHRVNRLNS